MVPELVIFVGPMFSSKTSLLLQSIERFKYQNKKIVAFKPKMDERYSKSEIVSHGGWKLKAEPINNGSEMLDWISVNISDVNVIAIDEFFMIPNVSSAVLDLFKAGKTIIAASLDLSATLQPFEEVNSILPYCTKIEKCKAICVKCFGDAQYTYAKKQISKEIVVGGSETFSAVCYNCHPLLGGSKE